MRFLFIILTFTALIIFLGSSGCTDAAWDGSVGKLDVPATVKCYSGTKLIYERQSTGAIGSPENSDGWQFREKGTNEFKEVSGNCVIEYID